ncbi:MAG: zinc-ribbon domain-containing protein [Desulfobacterales bacterium]|nr:zinc-ribbon domain-containing protein [Desulfobacterales bacterium]
MIVFCEECGKRYRIDPAKIKGESARLKCKACGHVITVKRQEPPPEAKASPGTESQTPPPPPEIAAAQKPAEPETAQKAPETPEKEPAPKKRKGKFRFGLTAKVFLTMLLVSLVPLIALGVVAYQQADTQIHADREELAGAIAEGLANHVDEWVDKNLRVLQALAEMPEIQSMNRLRQEPLLKAVHEAYPWMYLVFTVDPRGMNVARNDDSALRDYSDRQYYKDVMAGKSMAWQTLVGKTSKKPAVVLAVPIKRGETTVGVMAEAMTIDDISKRIATWRQGQTGHAFLVDEKSKVVAHPNKAFTLQQKNLSSHPLIAAANAGKTGLQYFTDDTSCIGYTAKTRYGWVLAVQQEEQEAFAVLRQILMFGLILFGATILAVFLISLVAGRAITRPINQLTDVAERISLGELDAEIRVKSKDEIGDLAGAIQRMADSIRLSIERLRRRRG